MRLTIECDGNAIRLSGEGILDRATALDLVEAARQAIHQQGAQERQQAGIVLATAVPQRINSVR